MDRRFVAVVSVFLGACDAAPPAKEARLASADSLVLERSPCYGTCPEYSLRIRSDGDIVYQSRTPGDTTRGSAHAPPETVAALVARARAIGFYALPEDIASDPRLCPAQATDHVTATITIFEPGEHSRVIHYHGCSPATDRSAAAQLKALTAFEVAIDSAAGSSRWFPPPGSQTR